MKKGKLFLALTLVGQIFFSGCMLRQQPETIMTPLQIREIQSRNFDTPDMKLVMKSMMNVLQDEGFMIKNAVIELGLLNSEKIIDVEDKTEAILCSLSGDCQRRWKKHQLLEASANVSEFGQQIRVRINFQSKIIDNLGCPCKVETIKDANFYQNFFEKVSKGIFIQEQEI
jgi:predicted metal-binding protein